MPDIDGGKCGKITVSYGSCISLQDAQNHIAKSKDLSITAPKDDSACKTLASNDCGIYESLSSVTCSDYCKFYIPNRQSGCLVDSDCSISHVATLRCCRSYQMRSETLCNMTSSQITAQIENLKLVRLSPGEHAAVAVFVMPAPVSTAHPVRMI
ncbi:hypothetical protein GUITHDRAFT_106701 [Guillardia theta CCMP2712]|uniref:Uncharacterized protein n=1 Tax=Guillardia theta (strain CCMP2712) TaxID=905079 RepID=L1JDV4_GUITC|nr:hypothetical protein GUITHDRAFT_107494 [Guillardia theta CCMP2712]XP_005834228.1 hypothetical protein GUITHDRAFT_106701 [Guillardia theta CCMP2712]EKX46718.1 hypothetical protein GUITHDRAFT_107494 [Guillardia theta CCMP2712]EKX47248.1 hypothetical protein GUITHDRAFT_106701 [Guillardia theta CCMP2712]|eukprot:XP_005833698.1 hypothetical protein GUITHDRAFT_107494 [Guillardia theta CCMP2712]